MIHHYKIQYRFDGLTAGPTQIIFTTAFSMEDALTRCRLKWKMDINPNIVIEDIEPYEDGLSFPKNAEIL